MASARDHVPRCRTGPQRHSGHQHSTTSQLPGHRISLAPRFHWGWGVKSPLGWSKHLDQVRLRCGPGEAEQGLNPRRADVLKVWEPLLSQEKVQEKVEVHPAAPCSLCSESIR